jgi:hypothetical protein
MIRALLPIHIKNITAIEQIKPLLKKIDELRDDRNFIAHGTWATLMPENISIACSLRKKSEIDQVVAEPFPEVRMKTIIQQSQSAMTDLSRLI